MHAMLVGMSAILALVAAVLGWLMAGRYGRRRALVVPVLALGASVLSVFRASGLDPSDAMSRAAFAMAFAGPAVAGAVMGILIAKPKAR